MYIQLLKDTTMFSCDNGHDINNEIYIGSYQHTCTGLTHTHIHKHTHKHNSEFTNQNA